MPHLRKRYVLKKLLKKLKFFPVVSIQGARQTGKSVLARDLLVSYLKPLEYLTFDDLSTRKEAETSPRTLLTSHSQSEPLVIDEAQKVPEIFDAIKFQVDKNRIPGKYILLGSTEFSILSQIRESLTGRMGKIRIYPFTLQETLDKPNHKGTQTPPKQEDVTRYLQNGGMPGMFAVRDHEAQTSLFQDWLELICYRDLFQFKTLKLDGDLAFEILRCTATLEEPSQAAIAKKLNVDGRKIGTHLKALCELFVLQRLDPWLKGSGKPIFLLLDPGVANFLGAPVVRRLHIWIMNERLAFNAYFETKRSRFYYYRSRAKTWVHLVEDRIDGGIQAYQCVTQEALTKRDMELMKSFLSKNPTARGFMLAPILRQTQIESIPVLPWESICSPVHAPLITGRSS